MPPPIQTPLIRLGNLFPRRDVHAKCEFLAPSGCFKIRGATHLLDHLSREGRTRPLVVPSMGNTALGAPAMGRGDARSRWLDRPQVHAGANAEGAVCAPWGAVPRLPDRVLTGPLESGCAV